MRYLKWFVAGWLTRGVAELWKWTYEFEMRYPNLQRQEGFSTCGMFVGRAYVSEKAAGEAMERHIRKLSHQLAGLKVYTENETVRRIR